MIEEIINNINYRLNEKTLTAEVTEKSGGYEGAIVIPETVVFNDVSYRVTTIGEWAFCDCKSLTSIIFQGTIEQWNEIDFGDGWNDEVPAKFVHCTDGDVEM